MVGLSMVGKWGGIGVLDGSMEIALTPSSNPTTLLYVVRRNQ